MVPTLHTKRLTLRAPRLEDAAAFHALANDADIARQVQGIAHPLSRAEVDGFLTILTQSDPRLLKTRMFLIERWKVVGAVQLSSATGFRADPVSIAFWIGAPFRGAGYAREAVAEVIDGYLFGLLGFSRINGGYFVDNAASERLHARLGFIESGRRLVKSAAREDDAPHVDAHLTLELRARARLRCRAGDTADQQARSTRS